MKSDQTAPARDALLPAALLRRIRRVSLKTRAPLAASQPSQDKTSPVISAHPASNEQATTLETIVPEQPSKADVDAQLGSNVLVFSPDDPMADIQKRLDTLYAKQASNEFGTDRWAVFFKPGQYQLDVKVGFYTTVHGLGANPDDTVIRGAVRSKADWMDGNATLNFWRGVENLCVIPEVPEDKDILVWATSQGTWLRRVHVRGPMVLSDNGGWSSGGYIADSKVEGQLDNGTQQQYFLRDTSLQSFIGGSYAQVFVGCKGAPPEDWPTKPYSNIEVTPAIREKPYLTLNADDSYEVQLPAFATQRSGPSWDGPPCDTVSVALATFYIARPGVDTAETLNAMLGLGRSILFTPGVYELSAALAVVRPNTVVLGLGLATLRPTSGTEAITVADVDGVHIAGLLLEASDKSSDVLCRVGDAKSSQDHSASPVVLSDLFCRVGGAVSGKAGKMLAVNLRDTIIDHTWLWRADHGTGVGWYDNTCPTGLLVDADDVLCYGLFVEHCQGYQTVWNGERGQTFFYQSEFPYDVPEQAVWSHSGRPGYASYKVADSVTRHSAVGLGLYCVFVAADNIRTFTAIEQPLTPVWQWMKSALVKHATVVRFGGNAGTGIEHVINDQGGGALEGHRLAMLDEVYSDSNGR
ncbi:unnamed protein product [Parajaminaea phylloscopi]